jgi:hypothetical protein
MTSKNEAGEAGIGRRRRSKRRISHIAAEITATPSAAEKINVVISIRLMTTG